MPPREKAQSNALFAAISNPERRMMLDLLRKGERPAGEVVEAFPDLPQPSISRHLKILREAGLVMVSPRAQQRVYSLQPLKLRELDVWVSRYRPFWSGRLESLEIHLDRTDGRPQRPRGKRT
jgi:DNA-binding transcriptional ArsR family regulator